MDWKKVMPFLAQEYEKGNVWRYDVTGISRELTEEMKEQIKELEEQGKIKVMAVVETDCDLSGEVAHMISYILMGRGLKPDVRKDNSVCFYSYVNNVSWDIQEYGDILLIEKCGRVVRIA
jgi:hypothetical protein